MNNGFLMGVLVTGFLVVGLTLCNRSNHMDNGASDVAGIIEQLDPSFARSETLTCNATTCTLVSSDRLQTIRVDGYCSIEMVSEPIRSVGVE